MSISTLSTTRSASTGKPFATFLGLFVLWWALLIVFNRYPALDIDVARKFFSPANCTVLDVVGQTCGRFLLQKAPLFVGLRDVFLALPYVALAILIGELVKARRRLGKDWRTPRTDMIIAALVTLAVGSGVLVNLFLKTFSGRPRPRETLFFGGRLDFFEAGSFLGQCVRNCSFISGEASSAGWLLCLILLLPARLRLPVGLPLAIISILIPVMRVMTGAHYVSDVVLGWLSSLVIFAAVLAISESLRQPRPVVGETSDGLERH